MIALTTAIVVVVVPVASCLLTAPTGEYSMRYGAHVAPVTGQPRTSDIQL